MRKRVIAQLALYLATGALLAQGAGKAVLFDHTHHEEGGVSAEWVICSGSEPDPAPANPAVETDWNGAISALAFDLHQQGYKVQTLPAAGGRISYGDSSNAMDLSHYAVFFIPECYTYFSATEKQAIMAFVQNGGGLFLVGNHVGASRVSGSVPGSTDAYTVFNDLLSNNGVANGGFGFTFVPGHGPGDASANTTSTAYSTAGNAAATAILHGPNGQLVMQDFHSYSYLNTRVADNPSVQGLLATQVAGDPATDWFSATATFGNGRVVATSDSSPADDGTSSTSGKSLHDSYTLNSNRAFFLNAIQYLASGAAQGQPPVVAISAPSGNVTTAPLDPVTFQATATDPAGSAMTYAWTFGDGGRASGLGPVAHAYGTAGTYTATFTASNASGLAGSASRTITVAAGSPGSAFSEGFESGTKASYATGSVTFASGSWTLNDALLGTSSTDRKNGAQSVRIRNSGKLTMGTSWATGAQTVTVAHGLFGTDASATWGLWYSTNGGSTWTQAGASVTTTAPTLKTATFAVNVAGAIRFELRKTDGSANRLNLDDFKVAGY